MGLEEANKSNLHSNEFVKEKMLFIIRAAEKHQPSWKQECVQEIG